MNTLNTRAFFGTRNSTFYYSHKKVVVANPRVLLRKTLKPYSGEAVQLTEDTYEELKRKRAIHGKKTNKFLPCDFLGTKEEEFENQRRLLKTSFVAAVDRLKDGDSRAKDELVERFKKYWVECSQTIQIYHALEPEEQAQFEEVCEIDDLFASLISFVTIASFNWQR